MSDLKQQAEALGIKVDGRWSEDRIKQAIDEAGKGADGSGAKPDPFGGKGDHDGDGRPGGSAAKRVQVLLHFDVWDENGERHSAGSTVALRLGQAKSLIAEGKAERADPFPGE